MFWIKKNSWGLRCSELRALYPNYFMSKSKVSLTPGLNMDSLLSKIGEKYSAQPRTTVDGLKIEFENDWVHLRKSNTEPIIRIYSEAKSQSRADALAEQLSLDLLNS